MFSWYAQLEYPLAAAQLILAMSGMGATLTAAQFRAVILRPQPIGLVLALQYVVFPVLAAAIARLAGLPPEVAFGLVLINAVPSGSFTNVFTYLGHGHVTLSIVLTFASTLVSFLSTPLVIDWLTAAELPENFRVPIEETLYPIFFFLVLPLIAGMLIARFWKKQKHEFAKWAVRASLVPLAMIIVGSLGSGRIDVTEYGLGIPALIVVFVYASIILPRRFSLLLGYNWADAFTIGIEVAVRNGNLAIALVASLFPATEKDDALGRGVFFVVLFYAGASIVLAIMSVVWRRLQMKWHERAEKESNLASI